jgi:hypothetical protein
VRREREREKEGRRADQMESCISSTRESFEVVGILSQDGF